MRSLDQLRSAAILSPGIFTGLLFYVLLLLTAFCFWPAITGPFVFDDFPNLQNLEQLGGVVNRDTLGYYLYSFVDNPGRPLSALSFLIEDSTWPAYPEAFKRDNILFHLLAGCLVFWLAQLLARSRTADATKAATIALACTALWLLQPMQLSATMLVVQRMNILSSIFMLAGLIAYLKILDGERLSQFMCVAAAGITLALSGLIAFLCKENGLLIFAYAAALNFTLLRERVASFTIFNRRLLVWGVWSPLLLIGALAILHRDSILQGYDSRDFTLAQRLLTEPRILFEYLHTILLPRLGGQGVFHDDYIFSQSLFDPPVTAVALLGVIALIASALWARRRAPLYSFAVLWFLAGHLLESTVVALELYFEHRNYLPMLGPLFALASLPWLVPRKYRNAAIAVLVVWLGTAGLLTRYNAGIWGDRGKLALAWAQQSPDSVRAIQAVSGYYYDLGDTQRAIQNLDAGIARLPQHKELVFQRILADCGIHGLTRAQWQRLETAAATSDDARVIPEVISTFRKEALTGRCNGSIDTADVRRLIEILLSNPEFQRTPETKGFLHYELAQLAFADRNLDEMMRQMDLSNEFRPNPLVSREQAIYLLTAGLPDQALEYLDRSDNTPLPWFKAWVLDIKHKNQPLRRSAVEMQETMRHQASP